MIETARARRVALEIAHSFPGFHHDSLEGELVRFRFNRALRKAAPGLSRKAYEFGLNAALEDVEARLWTSRPWRTEGRRR